MSKLVRTGRIRFRQSFFGRQILQVEVTDDVTYQPRWVDAGILDAKRVVRETRDGVSTEIVRSLL